MTTKTVDYAVKPKPSPTPKPARRSYVEDLFSLKHKVAVVTGAAGDLGFAIAEALLGAEATVIMVDSETQRLLAATCRLDRSQRSRALPLACDLTVNSEVDRLAQTVTERYQRLDVLVNSAGVTYEHDTTTYPDDLWRKTLDVNLTAPFQLAKRFIELMKHRNASIINVTSINAERGFARNPAYVASKGGLKQLTKSLAVDLASLGIRVNNVGPGYFQTSMTSRSRADPARNEQVTKQTLTDRWGVPQDLAGVMILLASDASRYITGVDIYVDGGWLAKGFQ